MTKAMHEKPQTEPFPAPWSWEFHPDNHEPIALVSPAGDVLLATGDYDRSWAHVSPLHRATLAAAPDMLDVLRHIQDQITYLQKSYGTDGFPAIIARRVREVIAKAEGATP